MLRAQQLGLPVDRVVDAPERDLARRSLPSVGLFAGIGGIERGLAKAGHPTLQLCELDEYANVVLADRFPRVPVHEDVQTLRSLPAETKLLAGGFPCQDLSQAGKTAGISGSRSGLVEEMFRLAKRHRTPFLVLENVPFMLHLSKGRALDVIMTRLEKLGYNWAYRVVDSRAFGLPQRRRRVIIVAALDEDPRRVLFADDAGRPEEVDPADRACGFYWTEGNRGLGWTVDAVPTLKGGSSVGVPSPPAIWMPDGRVVTPDIRDAERLQGFPKDWTRAVSRTGRAKWRWKLVGNAVSVPVAKWVGDRLAKPGGYRVGDVRRVKAGESWPKCAWNVGEGRFTGEVSEWPKCYRQKPLDEFLLHEPKLLSERATAGFLGRLRRSSLRIPDGFVEALEDHLEDVRA